MHVLFVQPTKQTKPPMVVLSSLSSRSKVIGSGGSRTRKFTVFLSRGGRACPRLNGRRLSTFELRTFSAMTPDRFAIIPVSPGPAPADAIMTGSMSAVMERIVDSQARADALEQAARAVEDAAEAERLQDMARANTVQMITDTVAHLAGRLDSLSARRAERAR